MISINDNDSRRRSKMVRETTREIVGKQSPVRRWAVFFRHPRRRAAATATVDARLSAPPQNAMIYFLSNFLFSLWGTNSPTTRYLARPINSPPPFFSSVIRFTCEARESFKSTMTSGTSGWRRRGREREVTKGWF